MIKVIFFKSKYGNWADKLIDWWTGGKGFSHVEIVPIYSIEKEEPKIYNSVAASQYENKVRLGYIKRSEKWVGVNIWIDKEKRTDLILFINNQLEKKYDWLGLLLFRWRHHKDKWFCSELVAEALKVGGYEPLQDVESYTLSPNDLWEVLR